MQTFAKTITKADGSERVQFSVKIKKFDSVQRLVYGEVYAPNVIDTHGHMMTADEVQKMAHGFMIAGKNAAVDVMHNNIVINASVVESFVARDGDPDYADGAWVAVTKIFDDEVWQKVQDGQLNGYSMEVQTRLINALVEISTDAVATGYTAIAVEHDHIYYVELDDFGKVLRGKTSEVNGHSHSISMGTATDEHDGHSHRFTLP